MTWFNVNGDYKNAFAAEVDALWASDSPNGQLNARIGELQSEIRQREKHGDDITTQLTRLRELFAQKRKAVTNLVEAYVRDTGERPDARQLDRLATWLLKGAEHGNIDAEVLTAPQRYRRKKRELPDMLIDGKIMNDDGNTYREPKPSMDEKGSHFEYVRMPSDNEDKRKFNGPMRRYNVNFNGKK